MEDVFLWDPRHILNAYQALQEWSYPRAEIPEEELSALSFQYARRIVVPYMVEHVDKLLFRGETCPHDRPIIAKNGRNFKQFGRILKNRAIFILVEEGVDRLWGKCA